MPLKEITLFYDYSCPACARIRTTLLEPLTAKGVKTNFLNVDDPGNFYKLLAIQAKYKKTYHSPTVVGENFILVGEKEIENNLMKMLELTQSNVLKTTTVVNPPLLTFGAVSGAGLIDSINPCALATIIFFIAYLKVRNLNRKNILAAGLSFCLGVFVTYFLVGLGLLKTIYQLKIVFYIRTVLNLITALSCFVLAFLAFGDARQLRVPGSKKQSLQLPDWAKNLIHQKIRLNSRQIENQTSILNILGLGFLLGLVISIIEGICTGQVYLPTIVFLTKQQPSLGAYLWLLWYNFLFALPILLLVFLVYFGLSQKKLEKIFNQNLGMLKILLGLIFIILGLALIFH